MQQHDRVDFAVSRLRDSWLRQREVVVRGGEPFGLQTPN